MARTLIGRFAHTRRRPAFPFVLALSILFAASACSSNSTTEAGGGTGTLTKISVGYSQPVDYQIVKIAIEQGYFKQQGLDAELKPVTTGAQMIALVTSGQVQFAQVNQQIILNAVKQGSDLKVCQAGSAIQRTPTGASIAAITLPSTGIKSAAGLSGKTVAVNALATAYTDVTQEMLAKNGVDPNSAKIVVVPFNLMLQALKQTRVDAAVIQSPYLGQALAGGATAIDYPTNYLAPNTLWTSCFVLGSYASDHRDLVQKYAAAMKQAVAYANTHQVDAEKYAAQAANVPFVKDTRYPIWYDHVDASSLQNWIDLMNKYQHANLSIDPQSMIVGQ